MLVIIISLECVIAGTCCGFGEAYKCHWYIVAEHFSDVWNKIEAERLAIKAEEGITYRLGMECMSSCYVDKDKTQNKSCANKQDAKDSIKVS